MSKTFCGTTVGERIIEYMVSEGYRVKGFNIVYIEGVDPDTYALNDDKIDYWNDVRMVISAQGKVSMCAIATTEPGAWYTKNPMNPNGAARIAFGQHKDAWCFGDHKGQDALVQCGDIKVHRDKNEDGLRSGDVVHCSNSMSLNQHTVLGTPSTIGRWSAGCLVGRYPETHAKFMQMCRDSSYKKFDTTVLDGSLLHKIKVLP